MTEQAKKATFEVAVYEEECHLEGRRLSRSKITALIDAAFAPVVKKAEECDKLQQWVHDLQSGMYINCVYCGHRYGPNDEVPVTMADVLKKHIEQCPKHPMSALLKERDNLKKALRDLVKADNALYNATRWRPEDDHIEAEWDAASVAIAAAEKLLEPQIDKFETGEIAP